MLYYYNNGCAARMVSEAGEAPIERGCRIGHKQKAKKSGYAMWRRFLFSFFLLIMQSINRAKQDFAWWGGRNQDYCVDNQWFHGRGPRSHPLIKQKKKTAGVAEYGERHFYISLPLVAVFCLARACKPAFAFCLHTCACRFLKQIENVYTCVVVFFSGRRAVSLFLSCPPVFFHTGRT